MTIRYLFSHQEAHDLVALSRIKYVNGMPADEWLAKHEYRECTCHDFGGVEGTDGEGYDFACDACGFCCDTPQPNYCPNCGAKVMDK